MPNMPAWQNDDELFALMKNGLYSSVIGDILDRMGHLHRFLPQYVRPLAPGMTLAGRAMPVLEADAGTASDCEVPADKPFGMMLEALDDLKKNEVYLCTGASPSYALIGELMCTRMQILGAAGAVVDGFHRDTRGILDLAFPCFSRGCYAQDQAPRGRVVAWRVPVEVGKVRIDPGDIVFGDLDGVVIVPREIENEVVRCAYEKATGEKTVQQAIRSGMSAMESFARHGIM